MSHHSREPHGAHDFSSPQIRVRGAGDFRQYSNQRLRLPNERRPLSPRIKQLLGAILTLAILGGVGVGVYFGVTLLLDEDESTISAVTETAEPAQSQAVSETADEPDSASTTTSQPAQPAAVATEPEPAESQELTSPTEEPQSQQPAVTESEQQSTQTSEPAVAVSTSEPRVSEEPVTQGQIGGAEIIAERVTAEPVPSGIPRSLADGAAYDPTEPATAFTTRWPVGTTLRLTRLRGATLLTDEEQAAVVGTETLVVVRGTESSNTDLQLSPAAFDQIAVYGTERIIAVRVEVTAAPP